MRCKMTSSGSDLNRDLRWLCRVFMQYLGKNEGADKVKRGQSSSAFPFPSVSQINFELLLNSFLICKASELRHELCHIE